MMCAATAGARGRRVLLLDHAPVIGEKIRISGGGRCNFTNLHCRPEHFISRNPAFCRSALARYGPQDFLALVEHHGIAWHEKTLGQLFCDGSATQIIDMLRAECDAGGVSGRIGCRIDRIEAGSPGYRVVTADGVFTAGALVIATGGLSIPKIGATPFGYRVAEQFGIGVIPPRAGLVPLTFDAAELARYGDLSGLSVDAVVSAGAGRFRENVLFTHRGLSGPAILQASSYWLPGEPISIDLLPNCDTGELLSGADNRDRLPAAVLAGHLPKRLAQQWCEVHDATQPLKRMSDPARNLLSARLHDWRVRPSGSEGYRKAEVTLGGVDTAALSSKTMGVRAVPGLYFIGEVVDVTGHLGGFNFQWAWASGHATGEAL